MPKGMLTFDLPEEDEEFRDAQFGPEWKFLTLDILKFIQSQMKHGDISDEKKAAFEEVYEIIWNSIEDRKLKAD